MNRTMSRFVEIQSISDAGTALVKFRDEKSAVKALIRINNMEIKGKKYTSNKIHYYSYRAFSGQNKIVYSTRFVTRTAIMLLM